MEARQPCVFIQRESSIANSKLQVSLVFTRSQPHAMSILSLLLFTPSQQLHFDPKPDEADKMTVKRTYHKPGSLSNKETFLSSLA